ncbi:hypothetical protein EDB80DRAFT_826061 [Ilyonectria destructans]|nr:hypothetical protein EDB80DRAFT_826061 [Ilyonectria destructans]
MSPSYDGHAGFGSGSRNDKSLLASTIQISRKSRTVSSTSLLYSSTNCGTRSMAASIMASLAALEQRMTTEYTVLRSRTSAVATVRSTAIDKLCAVTLYYTNPMDRRRIDKRIHVFLQSETPEAEDAFFFVPEWEAHEPQDSPSKQAQPSLHPLRPDRESTAMNSQESQASSGADATTERNILFSPTNGLPAMYRDIFEVLDSVVPARSSSSG